jgi:hypothetical protein
VKRLRSQPGIFQAGDGGPGESLEFFISVFPKTLVFFPSCRWFRGGFPGKSGVKKWWS